MAGSHVLVSAAEDEVGKVAILAAPLSMEAVGELQGLQVSAFRDTERAVKAALSTIGKAEKLFGELASRLAGVEIDCVKAAMMSAPLTKALDTNPHEINASELRKASGQVCNRHDGSAI